MISAKVLRGALVSLVAEIRLQRQNAHEPKKEKSGKIKKKIFPGLVFFIFLFLFFFYFYFNFIFWVRSFSILGEVVFHFGRGHLLFGIWNPHSHLLVTLVTLDLPVAS